LPVRGSTIRFKLTKNDPRQKLTVLAVSVALRSARIHGTVPEDTVVKVEGVLMEGLLRKRNVVRVLRILNTRTNAIIEGSSVAAIANNFGVVIYVFIVIMAVGPLVFPDVVLPLLSAWRLPFAFLRSNPIPALYSAVAGCVCLVVSLLLFKRYRSSLIPNRPSVPLAWADPPVAPVANTL